MANSIFSEVNNALVTLAKDTNIDSTDNSIKEYIDCVHDLLDHEMVISLKNYVQHGGITRLNHSLNVSYISYLVCKRLGFDYISAARGGLLHDFFLYNWHDKSVEKKPYKGMHGTAHPRVALKNANKYFNLNKREQDIIRKHMWPLTLSLPRYKESYVILSVDKYCAIAEFFNMRRIERITTIIRGAVYAQYFA